MNKQWKYIFSDGDFARYNSTGNRLELFCNGDAAFKALWKDIASAEKRVWVEIYILEADYVGKRTVYLLTEAANRGCDVILIYDRFGSSNLPEGFTKPLKEAGGRVVAFNPFSPWRKLGHQAGSILHRDHRKILIVDDDIGFCGGVNLSEKYAGKELV